MQTIVDLLAPFVAGSLIGIAYGVALWWSIGRLHRSRHSLAWLLGGAGIRVAGVVVLFALVMDGQWDRLLACLVGFLVARLALVQWLCGILPSTPR